MLKIFVLFFISIFRKNNIFIIIISLIRLLILTIIGDITLFNNSIFFIDLFSINLTLLTFWLRALSIIRIKFLINFKSNKNFNLIIYILIIRLLITFSFKNRLIFYFRFEIRLIPIFFIILRWGSQSERIISGLFLIFYTLFGSFPFFYILVVLNSKYLISLNYIELISISNFYGFFIFLPFLVKFPIYSLHVWLLKAHVEAPVIGSILLAGILLKLGGYGLIRTSLIWDLNINMKEFLIRFRIWGGVLIALSCLCIVDIKLIVAISSIVHIRFCVAGSILLRKWRVKGLLIIIVGHGLCSSGIFYICNLFYEISFRRSLIILKGLLTLRPRLILWWFLLCRSNISCPPRLNLVRELIISISIINWRYFNAFTISIILFFCACYSLYIYFNILHRNLIYFLNKFYNCLNYNIVLIYHWLPLNIIVLCIFIFC